MYGPLPRWIAHRGGGSLAPENTLAGIRLAARLGYRAVEFDVMLSAEGTPVLIHDESLARTTNGHGDVAQTPDACLFALDAGEGERIPRLSEALDLCGELGLLANVEIKPAAGYAVSTAEAVAVLCRDAVRERGLQILISSFSWDALRIAHVLAPAVPRGALFEVVPADWLTRLREIEALTLHCAADALSNEILVAARTAAVSVLCYTVNDPAVAARLFAGGVSALFTDRLDLFAPETGAYKSLQLPG